MYLNDLQAIQIHVINDIYDEETDNCYNLKGEILLLIFLSYFVYMALIACALIRR